MDEAALVELKALLEGLDDAGTEPAPRAAEFDAAFIPAAQAAAVLDKIANLSEGIERYEADISAYKAEIRRLRKMTAAQYLETEQKKRETKGGRISQLEGMIWRAQDSIGRFRKGIDELVATA